MFVGLRCWRDPQVTEPPTRGEKVHCWKVTVSGLATWTTVRGPPESHTRDGGLEQRVRDGCTGAG